MAHPARSSSPLHYRLRLVQRIFPPLASVSVIAYEAVEHAVLALPITEELLAAEIIIYAFFGPAITFLMLGWLLRRVRERDEAEARLAALYEVSRLSAAAKSVEELQQIALSIPQRLGLAHAGASLVVQDGPGKPWMLAGVAGLDAAASAVLQSALAAGEIEPDFDGRIHIGSLPDSECPLLQTIAACLPNGSETALCLSLSRGASRRVVLSLFLPNQAGLSPQIVETLESMAAGLAVAWDRASLSARQQQLLQQVEQTVRTEQLGLIPTLEDILAGIAAEHSIDAGAVYLLRRQDGGRLAPAACWPGQQAAALLAESALAVTAPPGPALLEAGPAEPAAPSAQGYGVIVVPIAHEGETLAVLVLAGHCLPEQNILAVVSSMMALLIRNSQLYAHLEYQAVLDERNYLAREVHDGLAQSLGFLNFKVQQVQRQLARGEVAEAATALQELHEGSQQIYAEVRMMIQGLRWMLGDQGSLGQRLRQYGSAFAKRTGLAVSVAIGAEPQLSPDSQFELFRVAQEALSNVSRHAQARQVTVRLDEGPEYVTLTVEDDGVGLQPLGRENGDHLGLRIMRERVQSIGGELKIESQANVGTALHVQVPLG